MRRLRIGLTSPVLPACVCGCALAAAASAAYHPPAHPGATVQMVGGCGKATAVAIAKRLHLGNADFTDLPVLHVLCGSFVGRGSSALVFSLTIPSCGLTGDWVVFKKLPGSRWRYVFESENGVIRLQAVGNEIKETQNVLRPGDAHCFPTGGTRSQIWHWNGSRLVGGGWTYSKP